MSNNICCATYCGGGARIECSCACFCCSTWCCDSAECGGGLLLTCGSTGCLCDCNTFCNNSACCAGGAIRLGGGSCLIATEDNSQSASEVMQVDGGTCNLIIDSNCSTYGGGIYQQGCSCTCLQNFEVKSNQANCYGGGFYTQGCSCFDLCCGKFECNCAKYGGGIYATSACSGCLCCVDFCCNCANSSVSVNFNNSVTAVDESDSNTCYGSGGGMRMQCSSNVNFNDVCFTENCAGMFGGGLFVSNSCACFCNTNFCCNCTAGYGGGLFVQTCSCVDFCGCNCFKDNCASSCGNSWFLSGECICFHIASGSCIEDHDGGGSSQIDVYMTQVCCNTENRYCCCWTETSAAASRTRSVGGALQELAEADAAKVIVDGTYKAYGDYSEFDGCFIVNKGGLLAMNENTVIEPDEDESYGTTIVIEDGGTLDLSGREATEGIELKKLEIKGGGVMKVKANEYNAKAKTATIPAFKVGDLKISDNAIIEGGDDDSTYLFAISGTTKYTLKSGKVSKA